MKAIYGIIFFFTCLVTYGYGPEVKTEVYTTASGETVLHCNFSTTAKVGKVWQAIATPEGLSGWAASEAKVELKIGGAYELYFNPENPAGQRGMEGNVILSFYNDRMISYSGGLPDTWVVYMLDKKSDSVEVHYYAIGTNPEWVARCSDKAPEVGAFIEKLAIYLKKNRK